MNREDLTGLLRAWGHGDRDAGERLIPLVYDELRRLAARRLRGERREHTLRPTGLVNEAYLRLAGQRDADWQNREQFFGVAAQVMRRVLVDHARRHGAAKRAGAFHRVTLDDGVGAKAPPEIEILDLECALEELAKLDPDKARLVELRYFGGLSVEDAAEVLHVSPSTVTREWRMARAWLHRRLRGGPSREGDD